MRIGLVTGEYPPDQGGVGDYTRELAQALAQLGHAVHVVTGKSVDRTTQIAESRPSTVTVHRLVENWGPGCWRKLLRVAREERLEVLDVQYQAAAFGYGIRRLRWPAIHLVPARGKRLPVVVVTFHDLEQPYLFPKAGPLRQRAMALLARQAGGVIVTNRHDEMRIAEWETRNGESVIRNPQSAVPHLVRIPIGSNVAPRMPQGYDRAAWRARYGVEPADLLLGYFGFLKERKGGEDLIETLATLVARGLPAHLLFIGGQVSTSDPTDVAYARRVDALIAARGLAGRVHHTGFVSPEEVSAGLAAVDVCVLPYRDGVSLRHGSLHACLAHGRAIVTTRPAVETPEFLAGENVLLAPPNDAGALAREVARVAKDDGLRARLEAGAAELAREFTWDRIAARTVAYFEQVTMNGGCAQ
jgi:glycosyltransferase involved in cell wall biosynthesis